MKKKFWQIQIISFIILVIISTSCGGKIEKELTNKNATNSISANPQNLIKSQGVKLPGGTELNGRQIYDDAQRELDMLMEKMSNTYELPPLDMIG